YKNLHAGGRIPDLDRAIGHRGSDSLILRADGDGEDLVIVCKWGADLLTRRCVPEADRLIFAGRYEVRAVGGEYDIMHLMTMSLQDKAFGVERGIPYSDGLVRAGGGEVAAIRTEGDADGPLLVATKLEKCLALDRIPDADRAISAARSEIMSIGAEGNGQDPAGVTE